MTAWQEPTTDKYAAAKASVPKELLPHFLMAVQLYQYHGRLIHNTRMISYAILAAMVKDGFRYEGENP